MVAGRMGTANKAAAMNSDVQIAVNVAHIQDVHANCSCSCVYDVWHECMELRTKVVIHASNMQDCTSACMCKEAYPKEYDVYVDPALFSPYQ